MSYLLTPYDEALQEILDYGVERTNKRTGIKTLSIFGMMKRYRLNGECFPILTRRKVYPKSVFSELLWFLSGSTNNKDLQKLGCNFWTPWVDENFEKQQGYAEGSFGPIYGFQLRHFGGHYGEGIPVPGRTASIIDNNDFFDSLAQDDLRDYGEGGFDQLKYVIDRIKEDPSCRRIMWSLWNPKDLDKMRLACCHWSYQIMIDDERRMTGMFQMRSVDMPIGCPANLQFYGALTIMLAQQTNCIPHELVMSSGDTHIYEDQIDGVKEYLKLPIIDSPKLDIKKASDIFSYTMDDFVLMDFNPGPKIEIPVAV